jgi:quinol monooxygenase YgiN
MSHAVEIRTYRLKPGTREEFSRVFNQQASPMLDRWGVDVVGFGSSLHDPNSFYLIRRYDDAVARERSQSAFYGSEEWRLGPRDAVLACIENYVTVVLAMDDAAVEGLRRSRHGES